MPHEPEDQEAYERNSTHAIARAVAAERERCAKIADDAMHAADAAAAHLSYGELYGEQCKSQVAQEIADAIRNPPTE